MERPLVTSLPQAASFEELVQPYHQALFVFAWRLTHDAALAQDLVQDTLLKAYRFLHRFESGTNFWAWLMTIMRNLYFSQRRKHTWEIPVQELDHLPSLAASKYTDPLELPGLKELQVILPHMLTDDVLGALEALPEEYRTTVLLADLLEYSYKDIATTMGCPMGTVMSRLHRGRQLLQKQLQQYAVAQGYIHTGGATDEAAVAEDLQAQLACA